MVVIREMRRVARQLADVRASLDDIIRRHGLCRIPGELVEAVEYRA
jgi:hypothetical protein